MKSRILLKNTSCFFLISERLDSDGVFRGAGIIVTRIRRSSFFDLTDRELLDVFALLKRVKKLIDKKYHPDGYTIGWNVGEVEQKCVSYAYLHVVPRYSDEDLKTYI